MTSEAVLEELASGDYPSRQQCLDLVSDLPLVAVGSAVAETVEAYIAHYRASVDAA